MQLVRERNKQKKNVEEKLNAVDLVTETDKEVEKRLISALSEKYPDHKFIGEESTADGIKCELTSDPTWIIDPIDGTMNFVHGYPNFCISIGYVVDKIPVMGVIYCPLQDWLFTARKGCGAFHNGVPIHVSHTTELSQALINIETSVRSSDPNKMKVFFENLNTLAPIVHGIRTAGSAVITMSFVAMGGSDAYFEFAVHAWDMAAGCVLVTEAGGVVIDPAGGKFDLMSGRILCASSQDLAQELVKNLKQYYGPRDDA
ncbi:hypothetical protein WDU94_000763 [Cyamophila willieti]